MNLRIKIKLLSKIFIAIILVISLSACFGLGNNSKPKGSSDLVFIENAENNFNLDYKVSYIDEDEILLKDGEEDPTSGRYANLTEDGKINWDVEETVILEPTPIAKELVSKVTIDGKKISLPMHFKDIGEEYAVFDDIDFSKITKDKTNLMILDKKSENWMFSYEEFDFDKGFRLFSLSNKDNHFLMSVSVDLDNNNISGISNQDYHYLGLKDIRVDGIGVGNTLNEAYNKFGAPKQYDNRSVPMAYMAYEYEDDGKLYYVVFYYEENFIEEDLTYRRIKNNVITGVSVYCKEIKW